MRRKRVLPICAIITLSLTTLGVEGAEVEKEGLKEEVQSLTEELKQEEEKVKTESKEILDYSSNSVEGGFHLKVGYGRDETYEDFKEIVPTFTVELYSAGGTKLGTAVGDRSNYKEGEGYDLHFKDVPAFKKGDKFTLKLKSGDNVVTGLEISYLRDWEEGKELKLQEGEVVKGEGKGVTFAIGTGLKQGSKAGVGEKKVQGSEEVPYRVNLKTDVEKIGVVIRDENENPVRGKEFEVERVYDGSKQTVVTDSQGVLWLEREKVEPVLKVKSKDENYVFGGEDGKGVVKLPIKSSEEELKEFLSTGLDLKKKEGLGNKEGNTGSQEGVEVENIIKRDITVSVDVLGDTRLTDGWVTGKIELTSEDREYNTSFDIVKGITTVEGIPEGKYKVQGKSDQAKITVEGELEVKGEGVELDIKVEPLYTLAIKGEGNQPYNFSFVNVINVQGVEFKGRGVEKFGVVKGGEYDISDNTEGRVHKVKIKEGGFETRLELGVAKEEASSEQQVKKKEEKKSNAGLVLAGGVGLGLAVVVGNVLRKGRESEEEQDYDEVTLEDWDEDEWGD